MHKGVFVNKEKLFFFGRAPNSPPSRTHNSDDTLSVICCFEMYIFGAMYACVLVDLCARGTCTSVTASFMPFHITPHTERLPTS